MIVARTAIASGASAWATTSGSGSHSLSPRLLLALQYAQVQQQRRSATSGTRSTRHARNDAVSTKRHASRSAAASAKVLPAHINPPSQQQGGSDSASASNSTATQGRAARLINFILSRGGHPNNRGGPGYPSRTERAFLQAIAVEEASQRRQQEIALGLDREEITSALNRSPGNWLVFEHLPLDFPKNYPPPPPSIADGRLKSLALGVNRWQYEAEYGSLHHRFASSKEAREADESFGLETNRRLEYLGDGILEVVVRKMLYQTFPDLSNEGIVSIKNHLVSNDLLGHLYDVCNFDALRKECAEERWSIGKECATRSSAEGSTPSTSTTTTRKVSSSGIPIDRGMPRLLPISHSQKADCMEAFIAAATLDNDILLVSAWLEALLAPWLKRVQHHPRLYDDRFLTAAAICRKRAAEEALRKETETGLTSLRARIDRLETGIVARAMRRLSRPLVTFLFPEVKMAKLPSVQTPLDRTSRENHVK